MTPIPVVITEKDPTFRAISAPIVTTGQIVAFVAVDGAVYAVVQTDDGRFAAQPLSALAATAEKKP